MEHKPWRKDELRSLEEEAAMAGRTQVGESSEGLHGHYWCGCVGCQPKVPPDTCQKKRGDKL